jgi:O-antigen ligase
VTHVIFLLDYQKKLYPMRALAPRATDIAFSLTWIATFLAAVIGILEFGPAPIAILCIVPWFVVLFHHHPLLLVLLWPAGLFVTLIIPDYNLQASGFVLIPIDLVYFFTIIHLMIHAATRRKDFLRALQANWFISLFLIIMIVYIVVYTPLYGKSALGEARKFYFPFFFPILAIVSIKEPDSLRSLMLAMFFVAIGISMVGLLYLATGRSENFKTEMHSAASLLLLLITFSIIVCRINSMVLINKFTDALIPIWFLAILVLSQHRSVFLTGAFGLTLMFILYINRIIILSKIVMTLTVMLAVLGMVIISAPRFEAKLTTSLMGIVNPQADGTASWRMKGWQLHFDRVVRNNQWLFGEGLGGYYGWRGKDRAPSPHNGYMQMFLKFGLFGLCVYALLAGKFFLATLKARSKLSPGPRRAYVEMGIINFGAAHGYLMGYGIEMSVLIFVALAMVAVQLQEVSWRVPRTI